MSDSTYQSPLDLMTGDAEARLAAVRVRLDEELKLSLHLRAVLKIFDNRHDGHVSELARLRVEVARLRGALGRVLECDRVIQPPDQMDAVQTIARKALEPQR